MLELFIKRPSMTIIFILVFMVMGIVSIGNLIIEPTPKVEFPLVTIRTIYPGASPIEIETQIVKKIEDAVAEISQIKSIKSDAKDSVGITLIEFFIGSDVNVKSIEVKDKVEAILNELPQDAERPIIAKFDPLVQPIATLTLENEAGDFREVYEYADKVLTSKLSSIDGVASIDIFGGKKRQINVYLDNNLLIQNYLSISDVITAVQRKNLNVPGGSIDRIDSKVNVRFVGEFESVDDIRNLEIVSKEGKVFYLKDLGTVEDSFKDVTTMARVNGKEVVGLAVKKLSDGDAVKILKNLKTSFVKIKESLPKGMKLELVIDTTDMTLKETIGTTKSIFVGIGLTVIVLVLFLGDFRGALISGIVIPTSIVSTFFLMDMSHFSINFMTLLAFGTCLGTLIANALLIIENTSNHLALGKDNVRAAVDGTKEVLLSVIAGAGTNLVVFTPLAFMGGMVGQFMKQFGMTVVYATIFSILASVTLTPTLCALLLKDPNKVKGFFPSIAKKMDQGIEWMLNFYKWFFDFMMKRPFIALILGTAFFFTIIYPIKRIGFEFIPRSDRSVFTVNVLMPDGTPLVRTTEVVKEIEKDILEYKEVKNVVSDIGYDGEDKARITVDLVDAQDRKRTDRDILNELIPKIALIPEAELTLNAGSRQNDNLGDITIDITGDNYDDMVKASLVMKNIMEDTGYFSSIDNSYRIPKMEVKFTPNQPKLIKQNLRNADVGITLRAIVNGNDNAIYKENGEEYDINITLSKEYKKSPDDFNEFLIMGKDGLLPISSLGKVDYTEAYSPLKRRDKERIIQLNGYISKGVMGQIMGELAQKFSQAGLPEGIKFKYTGRAENMNEANSELGKAFILAVILTYMLLVAILDSFILPISISSSIITSFLGVFVMMFFLDLTINIGSMMAIVMVVGLSVNNAILLIEYAEQKIKEGMPVVDALWEGSRLKLKPILMTSIAIIAGTLPQVVDVDIMKASMGAVIIGGMVGSMFFTYMMIPAAHKFIYDVMGMIKRKKTN